MYRISRVTAPCSTWNRRRETMDAEAVPGVPRYVLRMEKVLIVGAGLGGAAAAWSLSRTPALRARFQVTLVQPGWRMGGKGASGRQAGSTRIHEHGLHMFMGWYERAFYMMREVYPARPDAAAQAFPRAIDAFLPLDFLSFGRPGTEDYWRLTFPGRPGTPGDDPNATAPNLLRMVVEVTRRVYDAVGLPIPVELAGASLGLVVALLEAIPLPPTLDYKVRVLVSLVTAGARGMLADNLLERGTQAINNEDFRSWLARHGANRDATDSSLLRALYDLAFAYIDGDELRPSMEAGSMLLAAIRMLADYRLAPVLRMRGGMGDVVFAPLYQVLRARGVEVKFFHAAKGATLAGDVVDTITLARQADLAGATYEPLINLPVEGKPFWCWPDEPDWAQLVGPPVPGRDFERCEREVGEVTLRRGVDFDRVVLAVPFGGPLGETLSDANDRWKRMRLTMKSVTTRNVQLWTTKTVEEMGWKDGATVHAAFVSPLSDWADMSHLLAVEGGPAKGVIYLCGVAQDPIDMGEVYDETSDWLDAFCGTLWPATEEATGFRYDTLVGGTLDAQYVRINDVGSERYTLSVPGSTVHRIAPGDTGFANLYVAGDWVKGVINGGCAEAAVEGGIDAADAIIVDVTGVAREDFPPVG